MSHTSRIAGPFLLILSVIVMVGASALPAVASPNARDCSGGNAIITTPASGAIVFGIVQIEGTASIGGDFQYYKLEVAPTGSQGWGDISGEARQQVINGQLGVWDSAGVPDGAYDMRLRVVDPTGNYCEALVTNVHVQNAAPPTPTLAAPVNVDTPSPTEAPPIQNAVPTPVPTIASPGETGTPGATATPFRPSPSRTPDASSGGIGGIQISQVVDAASEVGNTLMRTFLFGALAMAAILFLVGVIFFVRRVL